jgi:hypothetical protein
MDKTEYNEIYRNVRDTSDFEKLALDYCQPVGVVASILHQKIIDHVKKNYYLIQNKSTLLLKKWKMGSSIIQLSEEYRFPPTLIATTLLKEMGMSKKYVFNHLYEIEDKRLASEIKKALETDLYFSPEAHSFQARKGIFGEMIVARWLEYRNIEYLTEEELRKQGAEKTPDFLFPDPVEIQGQQVNWVESKAVFGNETEHQTYLEKQFSRYEELYGSGMVIYWYGYVDGISLEGHLLSDYRIDDEFNPDILRDVVELLNLTPDW